MAKILISAFADEYSSNFDEQISVLKAHNINFIEPRNIDGKNIADLSEEEVVAAKEKLDAAGIKVFSIGSPIGKIKLSDDFEAHKKLTEKICRFANILGAKYLRMFSFYPAEGQRIADCREEVIRKLGELVDIAEQYGITLCHENEAEIYGELPEACLDLLQALQGRLKCVFDMGNFVLDGAKPYPDAYNLLKDHIVYFHIKDALYEGAIVPPGNGQAQISEILKAYKAEYDRDFVVTLEPHLETFDGLNQLKAKDFDNPYKFETPQAAFLCALKKLEEITVEGV